MPSAILAYLRRSITLATRGEVVLAALLSLTAALHGCAKRAPASEPARPAATEVRIVPAERAVAGDDALPAREPGPERVTTASGLGIDELRVGSGALAEPGRRVKLHYVGMLQSGSVFDSSRERDAPITVEIGKGHLIKGFEEGVTGMRVGGMRRLTIPPELGYGDRRVGDKIPPGSSLIFEV